MQCYVHIAKLSTGNMGLLALKHTLTKGEKLRELDLLHATYTQLCFLVCADNLSP